MNHRGTWFHGVTHIDNYRKNLVFNFYQRQRFFCNFKSFSCDHRHPIAHKADFVVQRERIQRSRNGVRLTGSRVNDTRQIFPGQNRGHAFQSFRLAGIDALDQRMSIGRGQDLCIEHARKLPIGRKSRLALHQFSGIELDFRFSNRGSGRSLVESDYLGFINGQVSFDRGTFRVRQRANFGSSGQNSLDRLDVGCTAAEHAR